MPRKPQQSTISFPNPLSATDVQAALREMRRRLFGSAPTQENKPANALRIHDADEQDELGKSAK